MRRDAFAKILATLGPASSSPDQIAALFRAGANVFRLNFSHGSHEDHAARLDLIRALERETGRPIGVVADLQGPKLRVGRIEGGKVQLVAGARLRLDLDPTPSDGKRVCVPHPEVFAALSPGQALLIDDGRIRLKVLTVGPDGADVEVVEPGVLSDRKGLNVPDAVLPLAALTPKDRADLEFACSAGVDWVALSFVQRPEDVIEARKLIDGRAKIIAKIEKPSAVACLDDLIREADALMVARGDLGVELPPEDVPTLQRRIVALCRAAGKPVIVATQMLESMVAAPTPTRAEASDVATAVYEGADAVMLSAETASGAFPREAVEIMQRIIRRVEQDPNYNHTLHIDPTGHDKTEADAMAAAAAQTADTIDAAAIVTYTTSGYTTLRLARERPSTPIIGLTAVEATARRLALVWGVRPVHARDCTDFDDMVDHAAEVARASGLADPGDRIAILAGVPFGTPAATNTLRIARVGD
jgi:pyruvate kinase